MKINLQKMIIGAILITSTMSVFAAPKFNSKKSISVMSREDGSGTRGAFIELFGIEKKDANGKKIDYTTDEAAITNSTAVMLTSVAGDRYAIGYVSLGSLNDSVKAVKIDGADATVANINNGSYKISRPFKRLTLQIKQAEKLLLQVPLQFPQLWKNLLKVTRA